MPINLGDKTSVRVATNISFFFLLLCLMMVRPSYAQLGLAFGSGQGIQSIVPYRLQVAWNFGPVWREQERWGLHAVWESSVGFWDGPPRLDLAPNRPTELNVVTSGPMFRWQRQHPLGNSHFHPYAELGAGLSWLSETEIEGRMLSLHFQFEDKFGLGLRFGKKQQFDVALRVYHYSNCSIKRPNSGVNLAMANIGVWF